MASSWWSYVKRVSRDAPQHAIAERTGLSQSTINRWQKGEPKPGNVRSFAVAYDRPVLEAFIAAGFLNQQQANLITPPVDLTRVGDDDLLAEVARRMKR